MDAATFKTALSRYASGVCVITVAGAEKAPVGITVSSFSSLSLEPPLILFCLAQNSQTFSDFAQASHFGVSVLSGRQTEISQHFALGDKSDFSATPHRLGQGGVPLLEGALAHLECCLRQSLAGGDHHIIIGEVQAATAPPTNDKPLLYFERGYHIL